MNTFDIAGRAMAAQLVRLNTIASNLANAGAVSGTESGDGHGFQKILQAAGFPCTFRQRRGIDVAAGCGMLQAEKRIRQQLQPV